MKKLFFQLVALFLTSMLLVSLVLPSFAKSSNVYKVDNINGGHCIQYLPVQGQANYYFKRPVSEVTFADGKFGFYNEIFYYDGYKDIISELKKYSKLITQPFASILIDTTTKHYFLPFPGTEFAKSHRVSISPNIKGVTFLEARENKQLKGGFKFCFE